MAQAKVQEIPNARYFPGAGPGGYALNFLLPVRHAATVLEGARVSGRPLTIAEMAIGYRPAESDASRIRHHEKCGSDHEVVALLMRRAIEKLNDQGDYVEGDEENGFALRVPFADVRNDGKPLVRTDGPSEFERFGDLSNQMKGDLNSRVGRSLGDLTVVKASLRLHGWDPGFKAIRDENGATISGARRLAAAAELRAEGVPIADQVEVRFFGRGDAADAERWRVWILANEGAKGLTKGERQKTCMTLYGEEGWSQEKIAEALKVDQSQVSRDLAAAGIMRPHNADPKRRGGRRKRTPEQEGVFIDARRAGLTREAAEDAAGLPRGTGQRIDAEVAAREAGRREAEEAFAASQAAGVPLPVVEAVAESVSVVPEPVPERRVVAAQGRVVAVVPHPVFEPEVEDVAGEVPVAGVPEDGAGPGWFLRQLRSLVRLAVAKLGVAEVAATVRVLLDEIEEKGEVNE